MARFIIEVYELHTSEYAVEANSREEAIQKYNDGEAESVNNTTDYLQVAEKISWRFLSRWNCSVEEE
jgi:hypothetical protein